ncbi:hypothetical protein TNCV_15551 [Trichonephila clavipes]|nr:hypothetical protein TNCV_15551 [Trichonephila clavipes]
MEVTRVKQCAYIKIAVLRERNEMECHSELVEALGKNAPPYRKVVRCIQAPPLTAMSMLSVLGAWLSIDAPSITTLKGADAIEERRSHGRDNGLRKTESKDAICMD